MRRVSPDALELLARAEYPGNLRELRNQVVELAVRSNPPAICAADVLALRQRRGESPRYKATVAPAVPSDGAASLPLLPFKEAKRAAISAFERGYLQALKASWKSLSDAAQRAGLERLSLRDLLKKHGMYQADSPESTS